MEVFPELRSKRREYSREWEEEKWDLEKAKRLLETHAGYRKVMSKGQVKVYKRRIQVGREHKGKMALIRYDAASAHWTVSFDDDVTRCVPATEINRQNITTLAICDGDDVKRQTRLPD